jgi:hypothetical protein
MPAPHTFGITDKGLPAAQASGATRTTRHQAPADGAIVKLSVWMDTLGTPAASVKVRPVIYSVGNALLGRGPSVTIPPSVPGFWLDLPMLDPVPAGVPIRKGTDYRLGVQIGGGSMLLRLYEAVTADGQVATTPFDAGPADPLPTPSAAPDFTCFATFTSAWVPLDQSLDYLARLAFPEAQAFLGSAGPAQTPKYLLDVGWHGTVVDDATGSFAVVRANGPLDALVGKRVVVTHVANRRSVTAVVSKRAAIMDDLSLTRRLFVQLGVLTADVLNCQVQEVPDS